MTDHDGFLAGYLAACLAREKPGSAALVLSQLDPLLAGSVLDRLPEKMQGEVAAHAASGAFDTEVSGEIQAILLGQLLGAAGGPKTLAHILNRAGRSTEQRVLAHLDAHAPELAEKVRNQMFVFDDIASLTDREIQVILKETDAGDMAIALKGGSEKVRERILSNLDEESGKKMKEQMQYSGPVRMSDVERLQLAVVKTVRRLEEQGEITINRNGSDRFV